MPNRKDGKPRATSELTKLIEYESPCGERVARMEWWETKGCWVVFLSGTLKGGMWKQRREFEDIAKARTVSRWWVRDGIVREEVAANEAPNREERRAA